MVIVVQIGDFPEQDLFEDEEIWPTTWHKSVFQNVQYRDNLQVSDIVEAVM